MNLKSQTFREDLDIIILLNLILLIVNFIMTEVKKEVQNIINLVYKAYYK